MEIGERAIGEERETRGMMEDGGWRMRMRMENGKSKRRRINYIISTGCSPAR